MFSVRLLLELFHAVNWSFVILFCLHCCIFRVLVRMTDLPLLHHLFNHVTWMMEKKQSYKVR